MIGRRMGAYKKGGIGGIDANTLLMLHGEDFYDSSLTPKTITNNGGVVLSNSGKFNKCIDFTQSAAYLSFAQPAIYGTTSWTIDWWEKWNGATTSAPTMILGTSHATGCVISCGTEDGTAWFFQAPSTTDTWNQNSTAYIHVPSTNTWGHRAIVRVGTSIKIYYNGSLDGTVSCSSSIYAGNFTATIGKWRTNAQSLPMLIDEFRISNVARWTENFTPPTQPYDEG